MSDTKLLTVNETCNELRLGRTKVYELISSGMLRTVQFGAARRILGESVDELIETLAQEAA